MIYYLIIINLIIKFSILASSFVQ